MLGVGGDETELSNSFPKSPNSKLLMMINYAGRWVLSRTREWAHIKLFYLDWLVALLLFTYVSHPSKCFAEIH